MNLTSSHGFGFFSRSLEEVFFFFLILFPLNFFSPPSSLSFLLIRLCWGAVSIQKQKAPRWVFPSAAAFGAGKGENEDA